MSTVFQDLFTCGRSRRVLTEMNQTEWHKIKSPRLPIKKVSADPRLATKRGCKDRTFWDVLEVYILLIFFNTIRPTMKNFKTILSLILFFQSFMLVIKQIISASNKKIKMQQMRMPIMN